MLSFDVPKYEKVLGGAVALRPQVEKATDEISKAGYSNIFFIGTGGSYAHGLCLKTMMDSQSALETHAVMAAEFMLMTPKRFSKDSLCVFTTRSGDTKEIVAAAKFCRDAGARVVMYSAKTDSPAAQHANYLFSCYSDDDYLVEVIYLTMIPFVARLMQQRGEFPKYDELAAGTDSAIPYLIKGKEKLDDIGKAYAAAHKDCDYTMVVGSGIGWGEAYSAAMCIMEEMLWMKTKSIHATEFFHGTIELVEPDTTMLLFYGDDESRPLMDRVLNFAKTVSKDITVFDTQEIDLPVPADLRKYLTPLAMAIIIDRIAVHLSEERDHPLTIRRYYRQMEY